MSKYTTVINLSNKAIKAIAYRAEETEAESVAAALEAYAADGYTADELISIETRAYDMIAAMQENALTLQLFYGMLYM